MAKKLDKVMDLGLNETEQKKLEAISKETGKTVNDLVRDVLNREIEKRTTVELAKEEFEKLQAMAEESHTCPHELLCGLVKRAIAEYEFQKKQK